MMEARFALTCLDPLKRWQKLWNQQTAETVRLQTNKKKQQFFSVIWPFDTQKRKLTLLKSLFNITVCTMLCYLNFVACHISYHLKAKTLTKLKVEVNDGRKNYTKNKGIVALKCETGTSRAKDKLQVAHDMVCEDGMFNLNEVDDCHAGACTRSSGALCFTFF